MIVDERMRTYINSLDMGNTPFLEELEQICHQGTGADHPERNAELYKNVSGCKPAEAYSGGGDSHWLLHTSYVRIWSGGSCKS